jgi:hypothetical protein
MGFAQVAALLAQVKQLLPPLLLQIIVNSASSLFINELNDEQQSSLCYYLRESKTLSGFEALRVWILLNLSGLSGKLSGCCDVRGSISILIYPFHSFIH